MHTFLIIAQTKEEWEKQAASLLKPYTIDPIDITRVSATTSIGIAAIRELKQKIFLKPYKSEQKAVLIEDAQTLTIEAQNALLKTLEEPPNHTIIILLADNPDSLLPTILSRTQLITTKSPIKTLTEKEREAMEEILENLLTGNEDVLKLAQLATKDKAAALSFLEKMILTARNKLLHNPSQSKYLIPLKSFQKAYTLLATTNVNPRFTLEALFLSF